MADMYIPTKVLMRPHPTTVPFPANSADADFNGLFTLISYSLIAAGGSMGSIFIISAMTVVSTLMVRGNAFLASLCVGHLSVTAFVIPATCIAIMSGVPEGTPTLCHYQWLGTMVTFFVHVLSFMFIAIDSWKGLQRNHIAYYNCCSKFRIILIIAIIWFVSLGLVFIQEVDGTGPEICRKAVNITSGRNNLSEPEYLYVKIHRRRWTNDHTMIGVLLVVIPSLLTFIFLTRSMIRIKTYRAIMAENPLTRIYFLTDDNLLKSHVITYAISVVMWAPLIVVTVIDQHQELDHSLIDTTWWVAIANSCSFSFVYAFTNRDLGDSFVQLFYYCCCKSHVNWVRKTTVAGLMSGPNGMGARGSLISQPHIPQSIQHHQHSMTPSQTTTSGQPGHPITQVRPIGPGFGMVALGGGVSGGGVCGGGPFRAFRGVSGRPTDL